MVVVAPPRDEDAGFAKMLGENKFGPDTLIALAVPASMLPPAGPNGADVVDAPPRVGGPVIAANKVLGEAARTVYGTALAASATGAAANRFVPDWVGGAEIDVVGKIPAPTIAIRR